MNLGECPVICLCQNEEIFKNYTFTNKIWTPKGKCRLVSKEVGYGIMISSLHYQEFGFRYQLKVTDVQTINKYCALHPKYVDTDVETTTLLHTNKEYITTGRNTLCQEFEYGRIADQYLTYDRMILQLEDCTKILRDIYPVIDFTFIFDHP